MANESQVDATEPPVPASHRRKFGRLDLEFLACQFGPIVNLSAGGMCVSTRKGPSPGEELEIDLFGLPQPIRLKARVAWKKRTGLFKQEIGFQFLDVSPEMARKLTSIATSNRIKRVM